MTSRQWIGCALLLVLSPFILTVLYNYMPPVSSIMLQSALTGRGIHRSWVNLKHISPAMINATLAAEDGRFCDHNGIDWEAVDKSLERNERSRRLYGASTIPMQVAKNLFLWNGRSWLRKAIEAPIALWIDLVWTKQRTLEVYLNIAQWGKGRFGIEQAAQRAFGKHASKLTEREAALLAAALPDPLERNARNPSGYHMGLANTIQLRMNQAPDIADCVKHRRPRF